MEQILTIAVPLALTALIAILLYLAKKHLDEESYNIIRGKLAGIEIKVELEGMKAKDGTGKMAKTLAIAQNVLDQRELNIVKKKGGLKAVAQSVFDIILLPLMLKKVFK